MEEKEEKNENENQSEENTPSLPVVPSKVSYTEKPKVNYKKDDIEEFDTDEEEEETIKPQEPNSEKNYTECISYEGDKCIYTEPGTGRKLIWNGKENKWCNEVEDKDKDETQDEKNEQSTSGTYGFENDTHTYTDPNDGTSYFWDHHKKAWFPKVDDDFMARYQMNYGFTDSSKTDTHSNSSKSPPRPEETKKLTSEEKKTENKRKAPEPPSWFDIDEAHNTTIYISNLPLDVTMDEVKEFVTKCGLLARDEKGKDKLKLYTDSEGELKGDARCTYIKIESVNLALNILDGSQMRDKTISVQRAKFQLKGEYDPSKKPKKKKKDKEKQKKIHEKLFDWRPERMIGEPMKHERVVIIKNLFDPKEFDKEVQLILEYQQDIRSECTKCGEVTKVVIYDRHPEGVAQVNFKEVEAAQACVQLLNGRWFAQRRLIAEIWDGRTKYRIKETEEQLEAREKAWYKHIEE